VFVGNVVLISHEALCVVICKEYYPYEVLGGKGGRCVRLTTSPTSCAECHENLEA
jgi:hypothetical protein